MLSGTNGCRALRGHKETQASGNTAPSARCCICLFSAWYLIRTLQSAQSNPVSEQLDWCQPHLIQSKPTQTSPTQPRPSISQIKTNHPTPGKPYHNISHFKPCKVNPSLRSTHSLQSNPDQPIPTKLNLTQPNTTQSDPVYFSTVQSIPSTSTISISFHSVQPNPKISNTLFNPIQFS